MTMVLLLPFWQGDLPCRHPDGALPDVDPIRFENSENKKAGLMISPASIGNATASCFNPGFGKLRSLFSTDFESLEMSRLRSTLPPPAPEHRDSHSHCTCWTNFMSAGCSSTEARPFCQVLFSG
jgi:hypothetical protein